MSIISRAFTAIVSLACTGSNMIGQRLFRRQMRIPPKLRAVVTRPPSNQFCKMPTDNVTLQFAKLSENGRSPTRGSKFAAGYDLYSAYDYVIPAGDKIIAKTDIQIAVPDGSYGRVAPRSGLAAKHFIDVGAGVIDQDYRGNVGVVMFNFSKEDFKVTSGDRIAQLICERIYIPELKELEALGNTERGSGGFGSTGKN